MVVQAFCYPDDSLQLLDELLVSDCFPRVTYSISGSKQSTQKIASFLVKISHLTSLIMLDNSLQFQWTYI